MRIIEIHQGYMIVRAKDQGPFFAFFVDSDSASWTRHASHGRIYRDKVEADSDVQELRKRAREREKGKP